VAATTKKSARSYNSCQAVRLHFHKVYNLCKLTCLSGLGETQCALTGTVYRRSCDSIPRVGR